MGRTPRLTLLVPLAILFVVPQAPRADELLVPTAMASSGGRVYFAYSDGTLWTAPDSLSPLVEMPEANRGIPIRLLTPRYLSAYLFALYEDNELGGLIAGSVYERIADLARPDDPLARAIWVGDYLWENFVTVTYDDVQIWRWMHEEQELTRFELWERSATTSDVDALPGQAPVGVLPNPSLGSCHISFEVPSDGPVSVDVVDASGRMIRHLVRGRHPAGSYRIVWDTRDTRGHPVPSGVYLTRIETADGVRVGRVVVAK
jgi:hypothetical protein